MNYFGTLDYSIEVLVIGPESQRTYIATVSKIIFLPIELKLFFCTFWTPRTKKLQ